MDYDAISPYRAPELVMSFPPVIPRLRDAKPQRPHIGNNLDPTEPNSSEHSLKGTTIWRAPIRCVECEFVSGVKGDCGPSLSKQIYHCFDDQYFSRDARNSFQCKKRMPHVIQHPEKQNDVELADRFGGEIQHIDFHFLHF